MQDGFSFYNEVKAIPTNKSKQTTQNTPGFATPPATPSSTALQGMVGKVDFSSPIRNSYARAEQQYNRSYKNPLGAYTTADVRDKAIRANTNEMNQNMGLDLSNAAMESQQNAFNQQSQVASLLQPRFYNASSTSSQPYTAGDAIGIGSSVASGLLS